MDQNEIRPFIYLLGTSTVSFRARTTTTFKSTLSICPTGPAFPLNIGKLLFVPATFVHRWEWRNDNAVVMHIDTLHTDMKARFKRTPRERNIFGLQIIYTAVYHIA